MANTTFSPPSTLSSFQHQKWGNGSRHQVSYNERSVESGYGTLSRPVDDTDLLDLSKDGNGCGNDDEDDAAQITTPRTAAAINYMSALQLSARKRCRPAVIPSETTPKKSKSLSQENIENESNCVGPTMKFAFRARFDRSHSMSPMQEAGHLDCTFDAISSSTPISQPFRADFYEKHVEEVPFKLLPRSGGKNTRARLIRKMQSFSPRRLEAVRAGKEPLREMDQNALTTRKLFPVEEEAPAPPDTRPDLHALMFGDIKVPHAFLETRPADTQALEAPTQLLDLCITNLSSADGDDQQGGAGLAPAEDGDVSMASSVVEVERYFAELKRNTTLLQDCFEGRWNAAPRDSLEEFTRLESGGGRANDAMEVEGEAARPALLGKRKRSSTEMIQAALATPKKLRRSQSFHVAEQTGQSFAGPSPLKDTSAGTAQSPSRLGGARKKLNYEPAVPVKRLSTARRRAVNGTSRLNIFRHLSNCPPVLDYFFEFVDDADLVAIHGVSRQCREMIECHPRLNARRLAFLVTACRKKENHSEHHVGKAAAALSSCPTVSDEGVSAGRGEQSLIVRRPLNNRNTETGTSLTDHLSPPVSPSRRRFHENQKLVQRNPGAFFVPCPRCRSCSVIDHGQYPSVPRPKRSMSMCSRERALMIPVRKQLSLPEAPSAGSKECGKVGTCQNGNCGFKFCVHCSYAFEAGHKCVEIGTLSPLIKQSRQARTVACSKQSKRNLKRL